MAYSSDFHCKGYAEVWKFVSEYIIARNQSFLLLYVNAQCTNDLKQQKNSADAYTTMPYHLENLFLSNFSKQITVVKYKKTSETMPCCSATASPFK